jgi:hypothetical protein
VSAGSSMSDSVANCVNFTLISNDTQIVERVAIPNFQLKHIHILHSLSWSVVFGKFSAVKLNLGIFESSNGKVRW